MRLNFKDRSLLILAITAAACSRTWFAFLDDPEGPNLLIVVGMAAILFGASLAFYLSKLVPALTGFPRSAAAILIQVLVAAGLFFALR